MPALRRVLDDRALQLRLLTPEPELPDGVLDAPVAWVHSSELIDPTPFLTDGQVLLTTGTQFPDEQSPDEQSPHEQSPDEQSPHEQSPAEEPQDFDAYVTRLAAAGVAAIGFGTEVVRSGTPAPLIEACLRAGVPLFEVPYRIPFIAVARLAADLLAQEAYARSTWALEASRAIALAALRPNGFSATLEELAAQTGRGVALFDGAGALDLTYPAAVDAGTVEIARAEAVRLLGGGRRASASVAHGGERIALQTLGGSGRLRGVLAITGGNELDQADRSVVTMVIAMAGLALEQHRELDQARLHLREGLLVALLGGQFELVDRISRAVWGPLPTPPLTVTALDSHPELLTELDLSAAGRFFAVHDGRLILIAGTTSGAPTLRRDAPAGTAPVADWADLPRGIDNAARALERARSRGGSVDFGELANEGVLAWLTGSTDPAITEVGRGMLQPLLDHDAAHGGELVATVRSWLAHDARLDAAAAALGVHRHTARARIERVGQLLGRDLATFADRAEVWAALLAFDAGSGR